MRVAHDLTNEKFGRLTALLKTEIYGRVGWVCRCACGTVKTISASNLKAGYVKSCGCLLRESTRKTGLANRKPAAE